MSQLGENIKAARIKKGLTQEDLAAALDTTKSAISRYETGKRVPRYSQIIDIARVLEVDWGDLIDDSQKAAEMVVERMQTLLAGKDAEERTSALIAEFKKLNINGQEKAIERVAELTEIPKYQKKPPQD